MGKGIKTATELVNSQPTEQQALSSSVWLVLGCGYVGQALLQQSLVSAQSVYSLHQKQLNLPYQAVVFDLDCAETWSDLPQQADQLLLTIPPRYNTVAEEQQRICHESVSGRRRR